MNRQTDMHQGQEEARVGQAPGIVPQALPPVHAPCCCCLSVAGVIVHRHVMPGGRGPVVGNGTLSVMVVRWNHPNPPPSIDRFGSPRTRCRAAGARRWPTPRRRRCWSRGRPRIHYVVRRLVKNGVSSQIGPNKTSCIYTIHYTHKNTTYVGEAAVTSGERRKAKKVPAWLVEKLRANHRLTSSGCAAPDR